MRAHLPVQVLWQSCWVFRQRGQGHRCFWLSCTASTALCKTKMQGGGIGGVWLGKYKMKSASHKTASLSTHKNTPKNQVKAQVQHEYYCCSIQDMMVPKLDWKQSSDPQITFLSFIFACDRCPGAASGTEGYLHISFHPPPRSDTSDLL